MAEVTPDLHEQITETVRTAVEAERDKRAEAVTLLEQCASAIRIAVEHEDGLDGKIAENLLSQIQTWQEANADAIRGKEQADG